MWLTINDNLPNFTKRDLLLQPQNLTFVDEVDHCYWCCDSLLLIIYFIFTENFD